MNWSPEAERSLARVPFFVRKRVRKRVEDYARQQGGGRVEQAHVAACQKEYLGKMSEEVKGYRLEHCFAAAGCPSQAVDSRQLVSELERLLESRRLSEWLRQEHPEPPKFHQEFRITVADCPNACSRPQIVDLGIIGSRRPRMTSEACSSCGQCVQACREEALSLGDQAGVILSEERCLGCGACIDACPEGVLEEAESGYRVLVGGRLGRHPRLGSELPGLYSENQVVSIATRCLDLFQSQRGWVERFANLDISKALQEE